MAGRVDDASPSQLATETRALLRDATRVYWGTPHAGRVAEILLRLDAPLRVALVGRMKAGKSTLLNALVGERLARTDTGECTKVVTWYHDGPTYRVTLHPRTGPPESLRFARTSTSLEFELGHATVADVDRVEVEWPSAELRSMTLIDTPGIARTTSEGGDAFGRLVEGSSEAETADAVIYLLRHIGRADERFLAELTNDDFVRPNPMNTVGVLSRADELSAGDPAAMRHAEAVAERYNAQPLVRGLCNSVVPVNGLLAEAGETMTETEFRHLRAISHLPADELADLLMAVDRFIHWPTSLSIPSETRRLLIDRLGVFGVRAATAHLRAHRSMVTADQLADHLVDASGLRRVRDLLQVRFSQRRALLKARSALVSLGHLIERFPVAGTPSLERRLDQVRAGAHELAELRVLEAISTGQLKLRPEQTDEAMRLLSGAATAMGPRLGLPAASEAPALRAAALAALVRWRESAESPLSSRAVAEACRVITRTCEGMLASLGTPDAAVGDSSGP